MFGQNTVSFFFFCNSSNQPDVDISEKFQRLSVIKNNIFFFLQWDIETTLFKKKQISKLFLGFFQGK